MSQLRPWTLIETNKNYDLFNLSQFGDFILVVEDSHFTSAPGISPH